MLDEILRIIGNVETFIGGLGAIVFTISYGAFFDWRKTEAGRALFYVFLAFSLLFVNNALGAFFGIDYPGRNLVRVVIVSWVAFTGWRLVWVLWRSWRKDNLKPLEIPPRKRDMK